MRLFNRRRTMRSNGDIMIGIYTDKLIVVCPMSDADMKEMRAHAETKKVTMGAILLDWEKVN